MIEVMTNNQRKLVIAGTIIALVIAAMLTNPRLVHAALQLVMPAPAGTPQLEVEARQAEIKKTVDAKSIQSASPATRPAIIGAKQKRIAEIRLEITALVDELNALLAE